MPIASACRNRTNQLNYGHRVATNSFTVFPVESRFGQRSPFTLRLHGNLMPSANLLSIPNKSLTLPREYRTSLRFQFDRWCTAAHMIIATKPQKFQQNEGVLIDPVNNSAEKILKLLLNSKDEDHISILQGLKQRLTGQIVPREFKITICPSSSNPHLRLHAP